ncbi:MAG: ABC transporter ATP-binding protein [Bacteroidota bacterium]
MLFQKLSGIFQRREKIRFFRLMAAVLLLGLLEVAGVASVLPFMELMADPAAINDSKWLRWAYNLFGFSSARNMLIASGTLVVLLITCSNLFGIYTIWSQYRFTWNMSHRLSMRLLRTYLAKPYAYFLGINTSELQAYLMGEVVTLTSGLLFPVIEFISRCTVAFVIFALLILVSPLIAFSSLGVLGGIYLIIYLMRQRYLQQLGEDRIKHNIQRYQSLSELLNGIKTIKANSSTGFFFRRYEQASELFSSIMPRFLVVTMSPKYVLEIFAFGGIVLITLALFIQSGNIQQALPLLSLYAVAGYRLLPALQRAFAALSKIRHNLPVLNKLHADLVKSLSYEQAQRTNVPALPFEKEIRIQQVSFGYENGQVQIFEDFDLVIPRGEVVALVGSTGSGKTTLIDLLVGLLHPESGVIKVDGQVINEQYQEAWRRKIAYVPQEIFLFDDTVLNNIAVPTPDQEADLERAQQAAQMASIFDFISDELPQGFQTLVGEKGVRLSGGQRQRLGLARALYRNPEVLFLDEATSALDNITEESIVKALDKLPAELTLIIIAHRLSSVRRADIIYFLQNGKIISQGSYEDLLENNETFRAMAKLS